MPSKRKAFTCDIGDESCGKEFTTKRALTRHLRESGIHRGITGKCPFECVLCPQTFSREHGLKRHVSEVHLGGTRSGSKSKTSSSGLAGPHDKYDESIVFSQALQETDTSSSGSNDESLAYCAVAMPPVPENASARDASPAAAIVQVGKIQGSLTSETKSSQAEICDKLCFLSLSQQDSGDPRLTLDSETQERLTDARARNPRTRSKPIKCSICYRKFETNNSSALFKHLDGHFRDLKTNRTCNICQIGFSHAKDLQRHLSSARQGSCGFAFMHVEPCSGHHPPPYDVKSCNGSTGPDIGGSHKARGDGGLSKSFNERIKVDDDRFNFCLRIQRWEQAQLSNYLSHVTCIEGRIPCSNSEELTTRQGLQMAKDFLNIRNTMRFIYSDPGGLNDRNLLVHALDSLTYLSSLASASALRSENLVVELQSTNAKLTDGLQQSLPPSAPKVVYGPCNESLERAACAGDIELTKSLLNINMYSWEIDEIGFNSLHYAALFGFDEILELLLEAGAPVDALEAQGRTSLGLAISRHHYRVAEILLSSGADPDTMDPSGCTILFICSAFVTDIFTRLLIHHGAGVNAVNEKTSHVSWSARTFNTDSLLCYPRRKPYWTFGIETAFQNAVWHGRTASIQQLLDAGASLAQVTDIGETLVDIALERGRHHLAEQLLDRGVPVGQFTLEFAMAAESSTALVSRILSATQVSSQILTCSSSHDLVKVS